MIESCDCRYTTFYHSVSMMVGRCNVVGYSFQITLAQRIELENGCGSVNRNAIVLIW